MHGSILKGQLDRYGEDSSIATRMGSPDFAAIAEGYGAAAWTVRRTAEWRPAFAAALDVQGPRRLYGPVRYWSSEVVRQFGARLQEEDDPSAFTPAELAAVIVALARAGPGAKRSERFVRAGTGSPVISPTGTEIAKRVPGRISSFSAHPARATSIATVQRAARAAGIMGDAPTFISPPRRQGRPALGRAR